MKESWRVCPGCLFEKEPEDFPLGRPRGDGSRTRFRLCSMCLRQRAQVQAADVLIRQLPPTRPAAPTEPLACGHPLAARAVRAMRLTCWACEVAA